MTLHEKLDRLRRLGPSDIGNAELQALVAVAIEVYESGSEDAYWGLAEAMRRLDRALAE